MPLVDTYKPPQGAHIQQLIGSVKKSRTEFELPLLKRPMLEL